MNTKVSDKNIEMLFLCIKTSNLANETKVKCIEIANNLIAELKEQTELAEMFEGEDKQHVQFIEKVEKESEHRAEVINTRDGTIKQLHKRIRKLENMQVKE